MAEQTPNEPTRRRVAARQQPTQSDEPPHSNGSEAPIVPDIGENRCEFGWPGISHSPFVPPAYYDQFPERFRPRFDVSQGAENLTLDQAKSMEAGWIRPIDHITIMNLSDKEDQIMILGATPGEKMWVMVPPFGVVRGPLQSYLNTGVAGARHSRYQPIGPDWAALNDPNCTAAEATERAAKIAQLCTDSLTEKLVNGETLPRCLLHGCTREGHQRLRPDGQPEQMISLGHAYYWIESIGQTLTVKNPATGQHEVTYTPDLSPSDNNRFGAKAQLDNYRNRDNRPYVHLFIGNRMVALERREAENKIAAQDGRQRTGR